MFKFVFIGLLAFQAQASEPPIDRAIGVVDSVRRKTCRTLLRSIVQPTADQRRLLGRIYPGISSDRVEELATLVPWPINKANLASPTTFQRTTNRWFLPQTPMEIVRLNADAYEIHQANSRERDAEEMAKTNLPAAAIRSFRLSHQQEHNLARETGVEYFRNVLGRIWFEFFAEDVFELLNRTSRILLYDTETSTLSIDAVLSLMRERQYRGNDTIYDHLLQLSFEEYVHTETAHLTWDKAIGVWDSLAQVGPANQWHPVTRVTGLHITEHFPDMDKFQRYLHFGFQEYNQPTWSDLYQLLRHLELKPGQKVIELGGILARLPTLITREHPSVSYEGHFIETAYVQALQGDELFGENINFKTLNARDIGLPTDLSNTVLFLPHLPRRHYDGEERSKFEAAIAQAVLPHLDKGQSFQIVAFWNSVLERDLIKHHQRRPDRISMIKNQAVLPFTIFTVNP